MFDILAQFDILGLATLLGALLFLGALVWVLLDNRSFEEVNRRHAAAAEPKPRGATAALSVHRATAELRTEVPDPEGGPPRRPLRPLAHRADSLGTG